MDDSATYRRVLSALRVMRTGLLVYVLTGTMAAVSSRVDGPSDVFVVLYRASVLALAAISALGLGRYALAAPWRSRAAVTGMIGYAVVGIAQAVGMTGSGPPKSAVMVLGFGIIAGFAGTIVVIRTVAHALELRWLAFATSLMGFGAIAALFVLASAHASSVVAGALLLVLIAFCVAGLTLVIRRLRAQLPDLPHAVIHAR